MRKTKGKRVAVAMSGGVDSSVAAALLIEQGYDCFGVTMLIEDKRVPSGNKRVCYSAGQDKDIEDAAKQASQLGIPHVVVDLRQRFQDLIVAYFRTAYLAGRTPNPCVLCNERIKFGLLMEKAMEQAGEFDLFATGHYTRTAYSDAYGWQLLTGMDPGKDQSYFLYRLPRRILPKLLFPLGIFTKTQVRQKAAALGLASHNRPQSVDFLVPQSFSAIFGELPEGLIVDADGKKLGKHHGIVHFTVGQRRGLRVSARERLYVHSIDARHNTVVVGPKRDLMFSALEASEVNWISMDPPDGAFDAMVKIRLNQRAVPARVIPLPQNRVRVEFVSPVFAVAPGQSAVFYKGETVLGGGVIEMGERAP